MTERPAFVLIRYRDPGHELQTVLYEFGGDKPGERALAEENKWQSDRLKRLVEVHVRRADDIFDFMAQNTDLFEPVGAAA